MRIAPWLKAALDFCYPGTCVACKLECDGGSSLCDTCLASLNALATAAVCDRCARPVAYHGGRCPRCRGKGLKPFDRIVSLGTYDEPMRAMILAIKYHRAWPLAEYLADCLMKQPSGESLLAETDVLVPLPLHPIRRLSRGYNQAALISRHLSGRCHLQHADALVRIRHTETQTRLHSRAKRFTNVKGAFALRSARGIQGKRVVLVDDVTTSGATLIAAARELRKGKPASISALVLAVADSQGRDFAGI